MKKDNYRAVRRLGYIRSSAKAVKFLVFLEELLTLEDDVDLLVAVDAFFEDVVQEESA